MLTLTDAVLTPSNPVLRLRRLLGTFRIAYLPVLMTYFCFGASAVTGVATVFFQKDTLKLTPADVAEVGFWLGLPWTMKMVAGVVADVFPIAGSRRGAYLLLGAACTLVGYGLLAAGVAGKAGYLGVMRLVMVGFMVQDVAADALSVEIARDEEEMGQIQALGRMAVMLGGISVGYLGGWLAAHLGARATFAAAMLLPIMVALCVPLIRVHRVAPPVEGGALAGGGARRVMLIGFAYAALSIGLEAADIPYAQEIVMAVSLTLIGLLLRQAKLGAGVLVAAMVIFLFRATPNVGEGYSYWAIDELGFDQRFLGLLSQVSSMLGLAGLLVFRRFIVEKPVSVTLAWVTVLGTLLYLPSIGLFYGLHHWLGISARTFAVIDTTISAPLNQLIMVPMLILIAKNAPQGGEATVFAVMASWMNLALSAADLFTQYVNQAFGVMQGHYRNLGWLMVTVALLNLLPLLVLPWLRRYERQGTGASSSQSS